MTHLFTQPKPKKDWFARTIQRETMKILRGVFIALCLAAAPVHAAPTQADAVASNHGQTCAAAAENSERTAFNLFVDQLLIERAPRKAFEHWAIPDLDQHNKAFGHNRETTIRQYEGMLSREGSKFSIQAVSFEGGLGTLRFQGWLNPGEPGASVTAFFRFDCGKIVETWDIFRVNEVPVPVKGDRVN